jgi:hypothetical protein
MEVKKETKPAAHHYTIFEHDQDMEVQVEEISHL